MNPQPAERVTEPDAGVPFPSPAPRVTIHPRPIVPPGLRCASPGATIRRPSGATPQAINPIANKRSMRQQEVLAIEQCPGQVLHGLGSFVAIRLDEVQSQFDLGRLRMPCQAPQV